MDHKELEEHEHTDIEPAIQRKLAPNEILAGQMKNQGIVCEALEIGSHPIEKTPTYSHVFAFSSPVTTNKGVIKVSGRNIDLVQVIQRC